MTTKSLPPSDRRTRLREIAKTLQRTMPNPQVELEHRSPWELLVATILSAQCTDQRVNQVTPSLFRRYRQPAELAAAHLPELEQLIRSTGFFKNKTKHLVACGKAVTERFGEQVPHTMEELITLPGVGRKTANVILRNCLRPAQYRRRYPCEARREATRSDQLRQSRPGRARPAAAPAEIPVDGCLATSVIAWPLCLPCQKTPVPHLSGLPVLPMEEKGLNDS